jgi:hypothetical protein
MELLRRRQNYKPPDNEETQPGSSLPNEPEPGRVPNTSVQVISGACVQSLDLAGLQISQAREIARAILRVDQNTVALVNGQPVRDDQRLVCGDTLEFVHHAGEKG